MGDLQKDDKQIVKRLAENERYNLVERPRMLFSFELNEQEKMFFSYMLTQNFRTELFHYISKGVFDIVIVEFLCWTYFGKSYYVIYGIVFVLVIVIHAVIICQMNKMNNTYVMCWVLIQAMGIILSMSLFFFNGPKFQHMLSKNAQQSTFAVF